MPHFASQWARLREKCLIVFGQIRLWPVRDRVGVSFTTGAVRSDILATAGLLVGGRITRTAMVGFPSNLGIREELK